MDTDEDFGLDSAADDLEMSDDIAEAPQEEAPEMDDASSLDDLVIDGASPAADEIIDDGVDLDAGVDDQTESVSADDVAALEEITTEAPAADVVEEAPASGDADADIAAFAGGDQANTKLDLAKAYIEMGDDDEARSLLEEVIAETDGATKAEAEAALAELG
jgi:pilus assembly protein FimV